MTTTTNNFNFVTFSNNVTVVNTTPHPVTIQDVNGSLISVPTSVLINAKAIEKQVSPLFVKTEFVGTDEGREIISSIKESFNQNAVAGETLVIIGSIIAAQAYPDIIQRILRESAPLIIFTLLPELLQKSNTM